MHICFMRARPCSCSPRFTDDEIQTLFDVLDKDSSGTIEVNEVMSYGFAHGILSILDREKVRHTRAGTRLVARIEGGAAGEEEEEEEELPGKTQRIVVHEAWWKGDKQKFKFLVKAYERDS